MHGLRKTLIVVAFAATLLAGLLATTATGWAAPPAADAGVVSCAAVEDRLAETRRTLEVCENRRQAAENNRAACTEELSSTTAKLDETQASDKACHASKDALCTEAAGFARQILEGRVANVGSCVPSKEQMQLAALLRGWENSTNALNQLAAFGSGESDTLPTLSGSTPPEKAIEKLLGKGPHEPMFYRRLLTEAVRLSAPQAWQRIHAGGATGVDAWFNTAAPLDPKLIEEVDRAHATQNGQGSPPVSAALRLVQSYLYIARCTEEAPTPSCTRARQLQVLFESTGPLLVRRRIEDIWATECHDVGPDRILPWMQDFPTPHITAHTTDYSDVAVAAQAKLYTCYLEDAGTEPSFRAWLESKLPSPKKLTARTLQRIDDLRSRARDGSPADTCGRAVRAMQEFAMPSACTAPQPDIRGRIEAWSKIAAASATDEDISVQACSKYARLLWEGRAPTIPGSFERPPSSDEMVIVDVRVPETAFARLRRACQDRHGEGDSVGDSLQQLARIARGFGEPPAGPPWRVDPGTDVPIEKVRFGQSQRFGSWFKHLFTRQSSCQAIGISDSRCQQCLELPRDAFYDCRLELELDEQWTRRARITAGVAVALLLVFSGIVWALRLTKARRIFATWAIATQERLAALGLPARPDPWRYVFPSHHDVLMAQLPREPAWEPWGTLACVARVEDDDGKIHESDVNHAVSVSRRVGARVVFLLHADGSALDLGAVRAILDWAAKGGARTMHVLPLAVSRLQWAHNATDLLELVEETSLRGNPFDTRGRITSSSQFWNRERLVSGLLAETRAGRWSLVTGLRRFGKSSLALEVARRLTGPSAYVDLAGFHYEFSFVQDPGRAVDAVLRSLCARLLDSARALYPLATLPDAPTAEIDAASLTSFIRELSAECAPYTDGRAPPILLILDEIEQLMSVGPERLGHVLDALAILLGRLRTAVGDAPRQVGSSSVGIILCSALHPLLWAPLRTLGQQSIIGAYPAVCVPHLTQEAAGQMMRGLGARQGIRFSDEALDFIVQETQGVPLLLRRVGTSVLELYDADHARQGGLGAVQIGIEGAREAIAREEREGAPLRTWVESEIAESLGPAGAMLRELATSGRMEFASLRAIAERHILAQFESTGITAQLPSDEVRRRAQEAASVMLRLLGETGLVEPIGDLTSPEAYALPDGSIRRVLRASKH